MKSKIQERRIVALEKARNVWHDAEVKVRDKLRMAFPIGSGVFSTHHSSYTVHGVVTGYCCDTGYVTVQNIKTKKSHNAHFTSLELA